ncbi:MAG: hypothetical protein Q4B77_06785 [Coriobacteriaceae bacterium]|nr:hypothetical protein [Coriobacteriaceae bacterium]
MSATEQAPAPSTEQQKRLENFGLAYGYNQQISRRSAIKAAFALAGAGVLFGMPRSAAAARATQQTLDALASAEEQLAAAEAQFEQIAKDFQDLSIKQDKTLGQIEAVQGEIDDTQSDIEDKQEELEDKQEVLSSRVIESYKNGPTSSLNLLLASESFEDLISNSHYVEKINSADKKAIDDVQAIRRELEAKKADLESQKEELEKLKAQQTKQLSAMQAKQNEVKEIVDGLSKDVKDLMAKRDAEYLAAVQEEERQKELADQMQGGGGATWLPGDAQISGTTRSQERVVSCCYAVPSPGMGLCAMWVSQVFAAAGFSYVGGNANDMYNAYCTSSNKNDLKVGMVVAVSTYSKNTMGRIYGHIGIYVGNNTVMENIGGIASTNLDRWISYYGDTVSPRWGWLGGWALE